MAHINVVGGGIFGCTTAIIAARNGHTVDLFEKEHMLLSGASWHNQWRLHAGYHYPRSPETGEECRAGIPEFMSLYGDCLQHHRNSWYGIVEQGGRTTVKEYREFLWNSPLNYDEHRISPFSDAVDWAIQPYEALIEPWTLRRKIHNLLLQDTRISVHTNKPRGIVASVDRPTVYALYDQTPQYVGPRNEYRFQLVEKCVVQLPSSHENMSVVLLDGPFGSVDPYGVSGTHLVGHVKHAVHHEDIGGSYTTMPLWAREYVNRGLFRQPPYTHWHRIKADLSIYLPVMSEALHLGSMFTIRCVQANVEGTDERPTEVEKLSPNAVKIVSGKIPSCVPSARRALELLNL